MSKIKWMTLCAICVLLGMTLSGCIRPPEPESAVDIGRPAPNFKLPDLNGREVSLDQFKGRVVMLDFWATWCGPCRMTMPLLEKLQKEYSSTMVLLAINLQDSKDVVKEYVWKQGLHSQVLLDEEGSVGATYGAAQIPMQVIIDKEGIVRYLNQKGWGPRTLSQLREEIEQLR